MLPCGSVAGCMAGDRHIALVAWTVHILKVSAMAKARFALSLLLSVSLAACGGGGGSSPPPPTGGGGGGPTPSPTPTPTTAQCSLVERQSFVRAQLEEFYLFPDLIDRTVNPANFTTVQDYIDALVAPARAQDRDRFFTYITSIQEENELINSGASAGFGIRLSYANNRLFVTEAFENAPGFAAGLDRGTEIVAINGQTVSSLFASGGAPAVSNALGPSNPGVTRPALRRQHRRNPRSGGEQGRILARSSVRPLRCAHHRG